MNRTYEYQGYTFDVSVEPAFDRRQNAQAVKRRGYLAAVCISRAGSAATLFSPLTLGDLSNRPFNTEADALMGGYSAARKLIDDLFSPAPH